MWENIAFGIFVMFVWEVGFIMGKKSEFYRQESEREKQVRPGIRLVKDKHTRIPRR